MNPLNSMYLQTKNFIWGQLPEQIKSGIVTTQKQAVDVKTKVHAFAVNYLTPAKIAETTKNSLLNAATAKIFPFSDPPGWKEEMGAAVKSVYRLKQMRNSLEKQLEHLHIDIENNPLLSAILKKNRLEKELDNLHAENYPSTSSQNPRDRRIVHLLELFAERTEQLERMERKVEYLEDYRSLEIKKRFAGYLGLTLNIALPATGIGLVASSLVTTGTTKKQIDEAGSLPENEFAKVQQRKTRQTAAIAVGCIAFSIFVMPYMKTMVLDTTNVA
jgi:hypothetical protein